MKGKIIGGYVKKCDEGKKWNTSAMLFIEQDFPSGVLDSKGVCVRSVCCEGSRLPAKISDMVGKTYFISTQNNFASDFYEVK